MWVLVATGAFVLLLIVISIFFVHVRNKNAKFNIAKKVRWYKRYFPVVVCVTVVVTFSGVEASVLHSSPRHNCIS